MPALLRILLVDDDETTNFLNRRLFQQLGLPEPLVAVNGQEALALLQAQYAQPDAVHGPTLILLDLKMPVMDGVQFLQAYAQHPPVQPPPTIIVLTTSHNPQDLARLENLPVAAYLSKPLTKEKITHVLQTYFAQE